jgi:hypothetical protein
MSKRTNRLAALVSRPVFFQLLLNHQTHSAPVVFNCVECAPFIAQYELLLNDELADVSVEECVKIYTDPVVNATLRLHTKWRLEHRLLWETQRADRAEAEVHQLECERLFDDDDLMFSKTTH